jgi:hypothetical protein
MFPRNTRKTLAPIMTNLILLCVAIAFTLATIAWIKGLPTPDICNEELHVTNHHWGPNCSYIDITLYNNATQSVKLRSVTVNSKPATVIYIVGSSQIINGKATVLRVETPYNPEATFQLAFQTIKGNQFLYNTTADLV